MACLDTDILIQFLKNDPRARAKFQVLEGGGRPIATTAINRYELLKGAHYSSHPSRNLKAVHGLLAGLHLLDFDGPSAEAAARIFSDLMRTGRMVNEMDVLIAAVCIANNEALVTNDPDFRRISDLKVEGW